MGLHVIGAGCGRTGTASLKIALERLLEKPCYHMLEVFQHPEHIPVWRMAALGEPPNWRALFEGYAAAVDWPTVAFWPELTGAFPDAVVLLSLRDPDSWWESASETIFRAVKVVPASMNEWKLMIDAVFRERWGAPFTDREASIAAFNAHNARVRNEVPAERLLVWQSGDGWGPICKALGVPVPDDAFPRANTRDDFLARVAAMTAEHK